MANYTIGLSGLQNTSLAIDTTSSNIANANTVGYKAGDYVFADQYFKAVNPSDVNRVGLGSERLAVRRPLTYGTINNSSNPLDMAIGGDGWFRVLTNPDDPTSLNYTRNGQFAVDKNGWIVNENGMYLTGYQPSKDGTSVTDDIRGLGTTNGKLKMPADFANGTQTHTSKIAAVLDSRENAFVKAGGVAFDPAQNTFNSKTTQTVFDSNGAAHTLEVYYRRITDSALNITSNSTGYVYTPGQASAPNTLSDTQVVIPGTSALSVQTPAITTVLGKVTGQTVTNGGNLTFDAGKLAAAAIPLGSKIFMNGRDTGLTVATAGFALGDSIATIATAGGALDVPASAAFSFYPADAADTVASAAAAATTITLTTGSSDLVGRRLFTGSTDTGLTVTAYNSGTKVATLSGGIPATLTSAAVTFKKTLDMTLTAPDGTAVVVQGTTNKAASNSILTAVRSNVEVYAAIDGVFYNYNDPSTVSNKGQAAETQGAGGYQTVATMGFIGGRNIDSLVVDNASGKPVFSTIAKLTTRVSNGSQQGTNIPLIFDLDLSDTQVQASSFQVNQSAQDGEPRSQLSSVSIDGNGTIVGVYGNGRKLIAGQIALAHFDASEQLVPTGGNSFAPSYRSGTEGDNGVRIGRPGEGSFGAIKSQAVEQSNVDLSNELVKLMLLQRVYSANSQSLRAFDQTMQDTIRMVG
ncbi:flagellar hook-basal body complex protein [Polynucleobacter sp. AP-Kolm-20A-A1]|uniref:flagellar hook-basal body complex protein n=1 Tax=Polynucleobacter sp. AP-Kolm-20A-A1 TaxID=2081041 RepID=UPI001BFE5D05|nr:flagellar hook-basal body complex protein [Polynucleobacter sp. AP-Kolm-20A-A1]QWE19932.1 flagellar hook-basal body complex protein [Polynucleobacter sp. AP-Kolm-20A-A1]